MHTTGTHCIFVYDSYFLNCDKVIKKENKRALKTVFAKFEGHVILQTTQIDFHKQL